MDGLKALARRGLEIGRSIRDPYVGHLQKENLRSRFPRSCETIVLFLVPGQLRVGKDVFGGGVISILSLAAETSKLFVSQPTPVLICNYPGSIPFLKYNRIADSPAIHSLPAVCHYFASPKRLIIHLPETHSADFFGLLSSREKAWIDGCKDVHINVLNQNVQMMPTAEILRKSIPERFKTTITTAHKRYCTRVAADQYGMPVHHFSTQLSPEGYRRRPYSEKENLLIVSPDDHPDRLNVMARLEQLQGITIRMIVDMTYEEYKSLIERAKWAVTFGEGLDGYFIEPAFSGAVSFAVYNEEFFTEKYRNLPTVYSDYNEMEARITADISSLDNESDYSVCQEKIFAACRSDYDIEIYRKNIAAFYRGDYTHP